MLYRPLRHDASWSIRLINASVRMVPLFPLIYSDRCIYSGYTYIPWRFDDGSLRFITMKSLLWGSQLGWVDPEMLMREENRLDAEFLKRMSAFRRRQHDLFVGGRFLARSFPGATIRAGRFRTTRRLPRCWPPSGEPLGAPGLRRGEHGRHGARRGTSRRAADHGSGARCHTY